MAPDAADERTRYETAKKELSQALKRKRELDKQLSMLETTIYHSEGAYLTETYLQGGGNIIQGFDNYLKNQTVTRRRNEVTEADRLFSTSSATYQKSLDLQGEGDDPGSALEDIKNNGPPTISLPAAKGSEISASQSQKKLRDRDYQRKKRANRRQSTVGVDSDDESVVAASVSSRRPNKRGRAPDDD